MSDAASIGRIETKFFEFASPDDPFAIDSGETLSRVRIAYETCGELNEGRDNAVLVFHALSASQHVAGYCPKLGDNPLWTQDCHIGWWDGFIGPGRALDTDKLFIICANYLGSCYGSTGPMSIEPETGKPYGSRFPDVTVGDIVRSQIPLLDHLGVHTLLATTGGSIGGMLAMELALQVPERVRLVIPIASGPGITALTKVHNFEQIFALQEDPNFHGGDYYDEPRRPNQGLVLARMISHKTFVSLRVLEQRARRRVVQDDDFVKGYRMRHRTESYMLHQGKKFARRFDANSYLKILTAWQTFDLARTHGDDDLIRAFRRSARAGHRYLIFSIDSDVCFYPEEQGKIVDVLKENGIECQHHTVHSEKGHDSFLIEPDLYTPMMRHYLDHELASAQTTARRTGKAMSFMPEI